MSKYSYELKKKIVLEYFAGEGGFTSLARKYKIPSKTRIEEWVEAYQKLGDNGLLRSRQQKKYSFEYKLHVVELYLSREVSYTELALQEGINKYGTDKEIIVFMHYPPITKAKIESEEEMQFVELMKKYNVKRCYYGHLHGASISEAIEGNVEGIEFKLVSADGLDFNLLQI